MDVRKLHRAVLFIFISGFLCFRTVAQSHTSVVITDYWPSSKNELTNEQIQIAIKSIKKAEANIADSSVAVKLESLGYLAIIKSGFTNTKNDKFQRKGWWMLSYPVALKYGLVINSGLDERLNLQKSTLVAYLYWNDLKEVYGDGYLRDLVFLESPIAVTKYYNDSINYPKKYNELRNTMNVLHQVKQFYDNRSLEKYVGLIQPISVVTSDQKISFKSIHHFLQIPTAEIKALNAQWVSAIYDPLCGNLLIPANYKDAFEKQRHAMEQKTNNDRIIETAANEKRLKHLKGDVPDLERYKPIRHKVKMGDNLGRIAQRFHVKIASIRSWNELKSDRIYIGQRLTIYVPNSFKPSTPKKETKKKKQTYSGEFQEYIVKSGDTLWAISQKFNGISTDIMMEDNGIDENISPGQVLKIRIVE